MSTTTTSNTAAPSRPLACDVLAIAPSEIGSNRQNRGNRFLTVIQYALDISLALREIARTMRPGALSILVLGRESTVRGVRFFNGELVAELAVRAVAMRMERRQERVFRNRTGRRSTRTSCTFARQATYRAKTFLSLRRGALRKRSFMRPAIQLVPTRSA